MENEVFRAPLGSNSRVVFQFSSALLLASPKFENQPFGSFIGWQEHTASSRIFCGWRRLTTYIFNPIDSRINTFKKAWLELWTVGFILISFRYNNWAWECDIESIETVAGQAVSCDERKCARDLESVSNSNICSWVWNMKGLGTATPKIMSHTRLTYIAARFSPRAWERPWKTLKCEDLHDQIRTSLRVTP